MGNFICNWSESHKTSKFLWLGRLLSRTLCVSIKKIEWYNYCDAVRCNWKRILINLFSSTFIYHNFISASFVESILFIKNAFRAWPMFDFSIQKLWWGECDLGMMHVLCCLPQFSFHWILVIVRGWSGGKKSAIFLLLDVVHFNLLVRTIPDALLNREQTVRVHKYEHGTTCIKHFSF